MGVPRLNRAAALFAHALALCACGTDESPHVAVTHAALRPTELDARESPPAYDASEVVEHVDSPEGFFRIHFTRVGPNAVSRADLDRSGVPDFVEEVASEYDAVLAFYRDELGFEEPLRDDLVRGDNGGDDRFDVYLLDFPTSADGSFRADEGACLPDQPSRCPGHMLHENDFDGRRYPSTAIGSRILASHELFHAVQSAYAAGAGAVIGEGTATWASEAYDPALADFEAVAPGYFDRPERSLGQEPTGPVDAFSYGSAVFFRFLQERFGQDVVREVWRALAAAPGRPWPAALDALLAERHDSALAEAFAQFAEWNLYTAGRADPAVAYARGADYPEIAEHEAELPFRDEQARVFPLSARYYVAEPEAAGEIRFELVAEPDADLDGLHLIIAREAGGSIEAIARADAADATALSLATTGRRERIHAAVANTKREGESLRPALCFGTPADVASCRAELLGEEPPEGTADAGSPEAEPRSDGGGCATAAPSARTPPLWLIAAALWLAAAARRRTPPAAA